MRGNTAVRRPPAAPVESSMPSIESPLAAATPRCHIGHGENSSRIPARRARRSAAMRRRCRAHRPPGHLEHPVGSRRRRPLRALVRAPLQGDTMFLPGSTDQAGYGAKTVTPDKGWLTRPYKYAGAAWYQKDVTVPESWRGRRTKLSLERPHWQTELWVDGRPLGMRNSLSTPHEYDLSALLGPGPHRLTICVDNSYKIDVGHDAHSVGEHTQTNWNGIVGALELRAGAPAWIDDLAIHTDLAARRLRVTGVIRTLPGVPAAGDLRAAVPGLAGAAATLKIARAGPFELAAPVPGARLWDEYDGALYTLPLDFSGDHREVSFGLRQIATRGTQFLLNGRPIFLRGTLECNIFPLTGY